MTTHVARPYQEQLETAAFQAWRQGSRNVLLVLPTGGGKTFILSQIIEALNAACVAIAHRSELVSQMSVALAREGVRHRVIGAGSVAKTCASLHLLEFGRSYYDPNARVAVASVDTLIRMDSKKDPWFQQVALWVQDEAHHVLESNKWGDACAMFPNARGLGVTATPTRADGKGLGRHADGLMDAMLVGPTMRELIRDGYLTDYRVFAPPNDLDMSDVTVTGSGDFSPPKLRTARRRSTITGDVVSHYLRLAAGKLGVTFDTDIESATETAAAYRAAGVPAQVVTSKTPDALRASILRQFRSREVLQLVNVDLFGEGFDLPAIEVVSMARPTQSYSLFCQQFGRALRPLEGKDRAVIIDHVGNVLRHGLPDARREWTLDRRERRSRGQPPDSIPCRTCLNPECFAVYERVYASCPFCGHVPVPADRSAPDRVDGDLAELDEAVLARMRGEAGAVDSAPKYLPGGAPEVNGAIKRRHWERQQAHSDLRNVMALWGGWQAHLGRPVSEQQRRFFFRFGLDVLSAAALPAGKAEELRVRVQEDLDRNGVRAAP